MSGYYTWDEVERELFTPEEIEANHLAAEKLVTALQARRLADVRRRRGLTQTQIAERMGITQRRVSAIEHGEEQATRTTLTAYIEALGGRLRLIAEFDNELFVVG
jgi:DNA-binding XRE family transcriptional regulator